MFSIIFCFFSRIKKLKGDVNLRKKLTSYFGLLVLLGNLAIAPTQVSADAVTNRPATEEQQVRSFSGNKEQEHADYVPETSKGVQDVQDTTNPFVRLIRPTSVAKQSSTRKERAPERKHNKAFYVSKLSTRGENITDDITSIKILNKDMSTIYNNEKTEMGFLIKFNDNKKPIKTNDYIDLKFNTLKYLKVTRKQNIDNPF